MSRVFAPVAALLTGVAILLTGQGLQGVLLPVRANLEGFPPVAVGMIGATYFLGFTLGSWKGSTLIRQAGHVRVFAAMTALASASPLLHGLWVNLWTWAVLRVVTGFCFAVLYVVIESWLNESSSDETRGRVFSAYILINMTVLAVGQQLMILADPLHLEGFALASVLVSLAAIPVVMSTSQEPRPVEEARLEFRYALGKSPSGMVGSLVSGLTNGAYWALAPVFVASLSDNISLIAWFMTAGVLGGAAGQFPLGHLSDRVDRRYVMLGVSACNALISGALWLQGDTLSWPPLLLLGLAWGACAFPLYTVSVAHANDRADPQKYVVISSVLLLMYGIGAIAGPFVASAFMSVAGAPGLFLYAGLGHLAFALYLVLGGLRRKAVERDDVGEFDDALTAALTASRVYEQAHQQAERIAGRRDRARDS